MSGIDQDRRAADRQRREENRGGRVVREPGSGGNGRNGVDNGERQIRAPGSGLGDGATRNGSGGSRGSNGGNIFSNFGDEIGRNPLGAVSNLFNDGLNRPMANLYRGQGQVWQQAGRAAQQEGRYYQQAGRRDGARAAYGDGLYAQAEYGRADRQASRFSGNRDDRRDDRPNYDRQQQGYGQGQQGVYAQGYAPVVVAPGISQYYGQNPYGPAQPPAPVASTVAPPPPVAPTSATPAPTAATTATPAAAETVAAPAPAAAAASTPAPAATSAPAATTPTAPATPAATTPTAPAAPTSLASAEGAGITRGHRLSAQRAPQGNDIPEISANQIAPLQRMLTAAGFNLRTDRHPNGDDGMYGPLTRDAIKEVANALGITNLRELNFRSIGTANVDPDVTRFMTELERRTAQHQGRAEAPAAAPAAPERTGPSPEQVAAQQRAAAEAQARAQRAAEDQRVPEAIRNTPFDPRNLARMSQQERYDLARQALAGIDELRSENSRPGMERMHDKMDESVRWANRHLGTQIPRPAPTDPLSVDAMVALGLRVANRGGLSNDRSEIVNLPENMTQAAMDRAAVQYLRALDRGVSSEDPSRAIRRFEERDMGRSRIEVDGLADPEMLAALRQAVAVRNGLLDPNAIRVAPETAAAPAPAPTPASVQTQVQPAPEASATAATPTAISGGVESVGPQGGPPPVPSAAAPVVDAGRGAK